MSVEGNYGHSLGRNELSVDKHKFYNDTET